MDQSRVRSKRQRFQPSTPRANQSPRKPIEDDAKSALPSWQDRHSGSLIPASTITVDSYSFYGKTAGINTMKYALTKAWPKSLKYLRLFDALRDFFGGQCEKLISYQSRSFKFKGVGAKFPAVELTFGVISTDVKKLEHATQVAMNLDNYQFLMCRLSRQLGKKSPFYEELIKVQVVALGHLTSCANAVAAFNADPAGESRNLRLAVAELRRFTQDVAVKVMTRAQSSIGVRQNVEKEIQLDKDVTQVVKGSEAQGFLLRDYLQTEGVSDSIVPVNPGSGKRKPHSLTTGPRWAESVRIAGLDPIEVERVAKELSLDPLRRVRDDDPLKEARTSETLKRIRTQDPYKEVR